MVGHTGSAKNVLMVLNRRLLTAMFPFTSFLLSPRQVPPPLAFVYRRTVNGFQGVLVIREHFIVLSLPYVYLVS